MTHRYVYVGDRLTDPRYIRQPCDPVLRPDGKCIVGRKPRNQLVRFADGNEVVVLGRRLRLTKEARPSNGPDLRLTTVAAEQRENAGAVTRVPEPAAPESGDRPVSTAGRRRATPSTSAKTNETRQRC